MGVGGASLQDEISRDCDLVLCLCLQSHLLPFTLYLTYTHALCSSSPELPHFMLLLSVPLRVCSLCLAHSLLAHRGILIVLLDSTKMSLQSIGLPKTKRELNLCFLCAVSIHCTLSHCYAYQTVSQDLFMLIYPTGQWSPWGPGQSLTYLSILSVSALALKRHLIYAYRMGVIEFLRKSEWLRFGRIHLKLVREIEYMA